VIRNTSYDAMPETASIGADSGKPVLRLLVLSLGTFALGMDAYVIAGLLPAVGESFSVSVSAAGQLATAFTLSYAVGSPVLAALFAHRASRGLMLCALAAFVLANVLAALAPTFSVLLVARSLAGMGAGLYSPVAAAAAAAMVPAEQRGRALAIVLGGLSAGTVLGVPVGLALAHHASWRAALWLVAALGVLAILTLGSFLPPTRALPPPALRQRFQLLRHRGTATIVAVTFCQTVGSLGLYTYIAPVLASTSHIGNPLYEFWTWGIGGVIGTLSVGAILDRLGKPALMTTLLLLTLAASTSLLAVVGASRPFIVIGMFLWGWAGWSFVIPQQHSLVSIRPNDTTQAISMNSSAAYLGAAAGTALAGLPLSAGLSPSRLPLLASGAVVVAVLIHSLGTPSAWSLNSAAHSPTETGHS
jgi:predicted MFS family arabinose efflux permease